MVDILFWIAGVALAGFIGFKLFKVWDAKRRATWVVPFGLLDTIILPEAEQRMIAMGFGYDDYIEGEHDCSDYAPMWKKVLAELLKPHRPNGKTEWMRRYSFTRDNGKPHQVVAINTTEGLKYIDTYRIRGSLYRTLSEAEQDNGRFYMGKIG